MFKKGLHILVLAAIVTLASVVAYAALKLRGPADLLDEAEKLRASGQTARAIGLLELADRAVAGDRTLRERLWRMRYAAQVELGNAAKALDDVESLLGDGHTDEELQLDQIYLLAASGQGQRARLAALAFLEHHPGHSRGLELAGEACQSVYQPAVRSLHTRLERDVGSTEVGRARAATLAYLYRPDGDDEVAQGASTLGRIYAADTRLAASWPALQAELRQLREQVQEGLAYFQRSLAAGGEPVAAFRGFAFGLEQAGRVDDLLLACEIQRRCFRHAYVDDAGALAVYALLRDGLDAAAVAAGRRWLPRADVASRGAAGKVQAATMNLFQARTLAAWQSRDANELRALWNDVQALQKVEPLPALPLHLLVGLLQATGKDRRPCEENLRIVVDQSARSPAPVGRPDLVAVCAVPYLESLRARGAPDADVQNLLTKWIDARPAELAPRYLAAEFLLERNLTAGALSTLAGAAQIAPADPRGFELRVAATRQHRRDSGQDGPGLLAQCLRRRSPVPEVTDPVGYLLCAEAALEQKRWDIAAASARLGADAFPMSTRPRILEIEAMLVGQRLEDAVRLVDRALEILPPDEATMRVALRTYRAAGLPCRPLLAAALRTCAPNAELQAELLRTALADAPATAIQFAGSALRDPKSPAELRVLAAQALTACGRAGECPALFDALAKASASMPPAERAALAKALADWLVAAAPQNGDDEHARVAAKRLAELHVDHAQAAAPLLAAAERLAATHPRTALAVGRHALQIADAEARNGAAYVLAGRLALRTGARRAAEDHWTAPIAFADGRSVVEDLVRLCLAGGRSERARQVYTVVEKPTDGALAARCGAVDVAAALVAQDLAADRADLLAHCTLAAFGQPSLTDWTAAPEPVVQERLELLALLRNPDFATEALERARRLHASENTKTSRLLLARALAAAGEGKKAVELHERAFTEKDGGPLLWREIAVASEHAGYEPGKLLEGAVMEACSTDRVADSPRTLAFGLGRMAAGFEKGGYAETAQKIRLALWQRAPRAQQLSRTDVDLLAANVPARDAFFVLDQAVDAMDEADRPYVFQRLAALGDQLVLREPASAQDVYAAVRQRASRSGPHGALVHFLLRHGGTFGSQRPDDTTVRDLLVGSLELAASGRDGADQVDATAERLITAEGPIAAAAALDELLRRWPAALPLWRARSLALAHEQGDTAGTVDLRNVLRHADAPAENLAFVAFAAANRTLRPDDVRALDGLPAPLAASAEASFARGLAALRLGKPDDAVPLLEKAPAQRSGLHLHALAQALLQSRAPDGAERAAAVLQSLARDYASSSLARNAGNFASQLAPRSDTAADKPTNR